MKKLFLFLLSFIPILSFAQGVYQPTGDLKQTGNYPIIWGKNVKGAPQGRATKAQMLAIPTSFRDTSMTCYVIETDSTYKLQPDLTTWSAIAPGNIAAALKSIRDTLAVKLNKSLKGTPNGLAELDAGGKVPMAQLPASLFIYKGMYNPNTNVPALSDATGTQGYVYQINVQGSHNFGSGSISFNVGDYVIHNGAIWQKSAGTGYVTSVNSKQGIVTLNTDDITEGTSQYFTNARAIGSLLNGYNSASGTISSSDNIVGAIGKLSGNIGALSSVYIQNQNTGKQSANFNISGSGTANSISLSGTDGSGNVYLPLQTSKPPAPANGVKIYSQNSLAWITSNGFSRTLNWPSTTADRVATFTDANGTVPFLESDQTWGGVNTFTANPVIKNANPILTLTETSTNYSTTLSKSSTLNNLSLTHQLYQAGGQGSAISFSPTVAQYGRSTDAGLPSGSSPFSISFFINNSSTSTGSGQSIAAWGNAATYFSIRYFSNPKIVVYNGTTVLASFAMPSNIGYHQVLITYNGSTISGYIDNVLIGSSIGTINTILGGLNSFSVGNALNTTNPFNGELDEVVIWNKALTRTSGTGVTTDEISANWFNGYGTPSPPSPSSIIRRYTFDEGGGSTAIDIGSNATNLSLINTPTYDLNGKVAKSGNIQNGVALSFLDGINNSERGQWMFGDTQGGTILQGRAIRHSINGYFPFLQGLDGHIVLDPSINISSPDINGSYNASSILKIGAGNTSVVPIQFASGVYNTNPLPGSLEYNGTFGFSDATGSRYSFVGLEKNQTFTGFNTYSGIMNSVSGTAKGFYINNTLNATANNDNLVSLDIAGTLSNKGGTALQGAMTIVNAGSGYTNGTYLNVTPTNISGSGSGCVFNVTIIGGVITLVNANNNTGQGTGYTVSDQMTISNSQIGGTGSGFVFSPNATSLVYSGVNNYSIRVTNPIIPQNPGVTTLGTSTNYYSNIFTTQLQTNSLRVLSSNLNFIAFNGTPLGTWYNNTGSLVVGSSPSDAGYRLDVIQSGYSGSFRSTGTVQITASTPVANSFVNTINPLVNGQTLIGNDFSPTFGTGGTALTTGVIPSANYSVTVLPTSAGSISVAQLATNGTGSGASFTVFTTIGGVTSIQVTNGGSGYAVGNTVTFVANGGTIVYTIPANGIGLTGVSTYAARFGNKITWTPQSLVTTPQANAFEWDGSNLYATNSGASRNQLAYLNSPSFSGTPTAPTAAPGTNSTQIATTSFVLANTKPSNYVPVYSDITGTPDLSVYATTTYVGNNYKPIGYVPSWTEITNKPSLFSGSYNDLSDKPSFFSGSYGDLSNKPTLFSGSYTDLSNKPTLFSGSYTDLMNKPDVPNNFGWFKNKLLDNIGAQTFSLPNSNAGSQLYISTNYSNGYGEVDYFSIPGTTSSARGHHSFYTYNYHQGTSGGVTFDFGTQGDNNAFVTGGPIAPNIVNHLDSSPNRIAVFDNNTNTINYRTPEELASDLGYALAAGYAVLNGGNAYTGDQNINGSITATGNITTSSDQRLKKNIVDLPSATQILKNIRAVSFDRIDIDKHQIGLLAQNVRQYYPELVEEDKNKMLSVNYGMFIAPLLKGWQEQQARIEELERKVKQLTKKK